MSDAYDVDDPKHPGFVEHLQERLDMRDPLAVKPTDATGDDLRPEA